MSHISFEDIDAQLLGNTLNSTLLLLLCAQQLDLHFRIFALPCALVSAILTNYKEFVSAFPKTCLCVPWLACTYLFCKCTSATLILRPPLIYQAPHTIP